MIAAADDRLERAERLLADHGLAGARVEAAGPEREVAVLRVPDAHWRRVLDEGEELAAGIRALGFRFVALDLEADPPSA